MAPVTWAITACLTWLSSFLHEIVHDSAFHSLSWVLSEGTFPKGRSLSRNQYPRLWGQLLLSDRVRMIMCQMQDLGGTVLEQCLLGNARKSKEAGETRHSGRGGVYGMEGSSLRGCMWLRRKVEHSLYVKGSKSLVLSLPHSNITRRKHLSEDNRWGNWDLERWGNLRFQS